MHRIMFLLIVLTFVFFSSVSFGSTPPYSDDARKLHISKTFGNLPLRFEKNVGQTDKQAKFISRGNGYSMYLTPKEAVMVLSRTTGSSKKTDPTSPESLLKIQDDIKTESSVIRMKLIGSNPEPKIYGQEKQVVKSNYLIGNDKSKWRTGVTNFGKVRYEEVYPGIDLVFYGNQQKLEYDFVVKPGADPKKINFEFEGEESIVVDWDGNLRLETKVGEIVEKTPVIYQEEKGERKAVEGKYVLAENKVSFELDEYDSEKELVIDPVLEFSTFLGGTGIDSASRIAVDNAGSVYLAGTTTSTDFPTLNAFQSSHGGDGTWKNLFLSKINSSGVLIYSTYLGGASNDLVFGFVVDSDGNAYVTGDTQSTDFPSLNAFQSSYGGGLRDAFIAKFNSSGTLIFSSYLGGANPDLAARVVVGNSGNIFVVGTTQSTDFPTLNAFQNSLGGVYDVFVAKISPSGTILFSSYLGGSGSDTTVGIDIDGAGNVYAVGTTNSTDFPTLNAFQSSSKGGTQSFVTKFAPSGSLVFSTYLGGTGNNNLNGIEVDNAGNVYVAGGTNSSNFPTLNAFQNSFGGVNDAFIAKFNSLGGLLFSSFLGGTGSDSARGIEVDGAGNAYVMGDTTSTDFPTLNAFQSSIGGGSNAFVTRLDSSGSLVFSTYLGGGNSDSPRGINADSSGNVYVTGLATSLDFPTLNAFQSSYVGGLFDGFIAKFDSSGTLIFSSYFGGGNFDWLLDIEVDSLGNIYLAGETSSTDFPTVNAFQSSIGSAPDAFVTKIFQNAILPILNDFDGDSKPDILAWHTSGLLASILIENLDFQNLSFPAIADPALGWTINSTGDFNGDKNADLLLFNTATGEYRAVLLDGIAVLSDTVVLTIDPSIGMEPRGVGDFDGDGDAEVIIYHPPSGFTALVYLTGGAFSSFEAVTTIDVANNWTLKDTGHFNADNKTDLLITHTVTGETAIIEMDGSVAMGSTSIFTLDPATDWTIKETGDFTGNGKTDILILHTSGILGVLVMDGLMFQSIYVPGGLLPGWELINVGIYDSDNKFDFLIYDTTTGDLMAVVQDGATVTAFNVVLNLGPASGWSYLGGKP